MSLWARKYCFLCYLAVTERSFEKSTSFQTECLQLSLSQSLLFYHIMQYDDLSSTQDEVMCPGQHFNNICLTNAKPNENCAENPLSLSSEVHTCTHGRVHRDSWTHFAIWKSCKCSTWAPQSFCNSTDKSQHPAASKEPHELCQGRLFSPSLSTVCISHRQACYFVKQLLNYPILVNRSLPTTTEDRGNLNDNCAFSFHLWKKKSHSGKHVY